VDDGLIQGSPASGSAFALTVNKRVKEAERMLSEHRACAMLGMDDDYMIGPRKILFELAMDFAREIREETGCELAAKKCKMLSTDEEAREDCKRRLFIPQESQHIKEDIYTDKTGDGL